MATETTFPIPQVLWNVAGEMRPDLHVIAGMIPPASSVLDLGCGDGSLLLHLRDRGVRGRGIELSEAGVLACVHRGLSVRQGNLQEGLADYRDGSFDYVVLAQTLPFLDDPQMILSEMLRVGRRAVVSFPNWGYWRCRLHMLVTGCMPEAPDLPQAWHAAPRWQALTIADFGHFCQRHGIGVLRQVYLNRGAMVHVPKFKSLLSTTAVFELAPNGHSAE